MANYFEKKLDNAIKICDGMYLEEFSKGFQLLYPFATENIAGYIKEFDLKDRSLLTVGSSADQIINASLLGCKDITCVDINPYVKFYFYLKFTCILELSRKEFLCFLRYKDYPKVFKDNKDVFDKETFDKIKKTLRLLDYESYLFWDELMQMYDAITIRKKLFYFLEEDRTEVVVGSNLYLQNDINYTELRNKLKMTELEFIDDNLFDVQLGRKFDNIWLSNIGTHILLEKLKQLKSKIVNLLNDEGKLLISYLYNTTKDTEYKKDWQEIYNLNKAYEILEINESNLISFIGTDALKFKDDKMKDSVLIYQKS